MRIKFIETHHADRQTFEAGQEYDVPNEGRAMLWVRSRVAELVKPEPAPAEQPADIDAK
jgi:hypothetical protein